MDEYSEYYVLDVGVDMIEVGHSVSENIGLRRFSKILKQEYPEVKVVFLECLKPWLTL
jgi:putative NIF3 family GTP cyclohydrolase 1 type 2